MKETGVSEPEACEYVKSMIHKMWKDMNKEVQSSTLSRSFIDVSLNLARMGLCMYQHGDGHTIQDPIIQNRIRSLIIQPIPIVLNNNCSSC